MEQIALFNAVSKNNNFGVTIDGRACVVSVPNKEIARFKQENKLTYISDASAYCNEELIGKKIKFTGFAFEKSGENAITYYSAQEWSWVK